MKKIIIALSFVLCLFQFDATCQIQIIIVNHVSKDTTNAISDSSCSYCFKPSKADLSDSVIINQADIVSYDWKDQRIKLTDKAIYRYSKIHIPLQGLPVAMMVNGEPLYGFWLWNYSSSFGCDWLYCFPDFSIEWGLPKNYRKGSDPRFNDKLLSALILNKLIINWP